MKNKTSRFQFKYYIAVASLGWLVNILVWSIEISRFGTARLMGHFNSLPLEHSIIISFIPIFMLMGYLLYIIEKRTAELHGSKLFMETALNSMNDAISIIDVQNFKILGVNQVFLKQLDFKENEVLGKTCHEVTHHRSTPCLPPDNTCPLYETIRTSSHVETEHVHYQKDGGKIFVEVTTSPVKNNQGEVIQVVHIARDITKRKEIKRALVQERDKAQQYLDIAGVMFVLIGIDKKVSLINNKGCEILGYRKEEIIGKDWFDNFVPERMRIQVKEVYEKLMKSEMEPMEYYENPVLTQKGEEKIIAWHNTLVLDENGNIAGTLSSGEDVTERRMAEERLTLFMQAVEAAADGVQIVDLQGIILYSNRAIETIYGFSPQEFLGSHVNALNADPEFAQKIIIPSINESCGWNGELLVRHKNGHEFPIWLNTSMVKNREGAPVAMVGIIRDISENKEKAEELQDYTNRLEEAQRLTELFGDILRHDLLNPVTVIQNLTEFLLEANHDLESINMLETIKRNVAKLIKMIDMASYYSKLETMNKIDTRIIDLRAVLQESLSNLELSLKAKKMQIDYSPVKNFPIKAHTMIENVFTNLLSNAIKYSPEGTGIKISVTEQDGAYLVCVKDTGNGIPDEFKKKIFNRYQRIKNEGIKGAGLGLAIAQRIVELHQGKIWVEDNPSGGCIFCVRLPKEGPSLK